MLALLRIFTFSAAFPFFNNVDEQAHLDTVVKYARGYLPGEGSDLFDPETADLIARYGTSEYFHREANPAREPYAARKEAWTNQINHEAFSPPAYYVIAAGWYNIGKLIGMQGGYLLYWARFLNLPVYAAFLWIALLFCRCTEPDNFHLRMGVMLLLAMLPQDVFYSINSDVLSPLFFIASMFVLAKIYLNNRSFWRYPLAGALVSGTVLVKLSNLPLLFIFGLVLCAMIQRNAATGEPAQLAPRVFTMLAAVIAPLALWMGFNLATSGDLTGASNKITYLGWTVKPFLDWVNHPIFTLRGAGFFLSEIIRSFWRGEFVWHMERVASNSADVLYLSTTLVFGIAGITAIFSGRKNQTSDINQFNYLHIGILISYVLFLALLSVRYDFGDCPYPSREFPYFTSGRLILASLPSFMIIYVKGIEFSTAKISGRIDSVAVITALTVCIGFQEIATAIQRGVFASQYNFFHLQ